MDRSESSINAFEHDDCDGGGENDDDDDHHHHHRSHRSHHRHHSHCFGSLAFPTNE